MQNKLLFLFAIPGIVLTGQRREPKSVPGEGWGQSPTATMSATTSRSASNLAEMRDLVSAVLQIGFRELEALRSLTCQQHVDRYQNGRFRDSTEFGVYFSDKEHYTDVVRAGHPLFYEEGTPEKAPIEYFGQPFSVGEYEDFLQEALERISDTSIKIADQPDSTQSNGYRTVTIKVLHPTQDYWVYDSRKYHELPYVMTIYVDAGTARIRRVFKAFRGNSQFPAMLWYVDYDLKVVDGQEYWVPTSALFSSAKAYGLEFINKIDFRNFKKFAVSSTAIFTR